MTLTWNVCAVDLADCGYPSSDAATDGELWLGNDLRFPVDDTRWRIFFRGFGYSMQQGINKAGSVDAWSAGGSIGYERTFGRNWIAGVTIGGNGNKYKYQQVEATDVSAMFTSFYGRIETRRAFLMFETGYGYNDLSGNVTYAADTYSFKRGTNQWHGNVSCGCWWENGFSKFEPFADIQFTVLDEQPYTDEGVTNIYHYGQSNTRSTLHAGLRYSWQHASQLAYITPTLYGGLAHELTDTDIFAAGAYNAVPTAYRINGIQPTQDRFFIGGGLTYSMRRRLDIYFRYTSEIAKGYGSHSFLAGMNWNF
jgi:uncharacterized protein with beta-barrel porin domain